VAGVGAEKRGSTPLLAALEVLTVAARLGVTSFGGPIAHLGYFRDAYVTRRRWLDEQTFADLVALCQFLPGPASSEVEISVGILRAGLLGGLAAWFGFTLPSAIALTVFAYRVQGIDVATAGWLHGLQVVAVAVVAQAVWGMARTFCTDRARGTIAILTAILLLAWPAAVAQVGAIAVAGVIGWRWLPAPAATVGTPVTVSVSRRLGVAALALLAALLVALPLARQVNANHGLAVFDSFFRAGALVFGGGHVVLPLLQAAVVPPGWLSNAQFIAGYGAAQAVPGPLFTFSAYLGAIMRPAPRGWQGAALALVAMFLPAFLLVVGALPFWTAIRARPGLRSALQGINAAVVGLLFAALYQPIWTSAIRRPLDVALALAAFGLLVLWKIPPWIVVIVGAVGGAVVGMAP